jgi:hypothetical protein
MKKGKRARLAPVDLPEFGASVEEPVIDKAVYAARFELFMKKMVGVGADIAVIYADREHAANLAWLSGFEPRFEEALLIAAPGKTPVLLTGPENEGVAKAAPLTMDVKLYPPMGLMGQERNHTPGLADLLAQAGVRKGKTVGVTGWKYFGQFEHSDFASWIEVPSYIVDTARLLVGDRGQVFNAGHVFMDPADGLRAFTSIDELGRNEFAACHTSESVKRVIHATRPGMREYEAVQALKPFGMPLSCHTMFSTGERAWHGLLSPGSKIIQLGEAVTTAYGVQGALNCRAGWVAGGENDLPDDVRDYVDILVAPYFEAIAEWLETVEIGIEGGLLDAIIRKRLGDPFFGIALNPGHLIHHEEWMHTPISNGSTIKLRSAMALQVDVIPATGGPYFTSNMEDGIALLDGRGRAEFSEKFPAAMNRINMRRTFMDEKLGIRLKPDCLPLSNIAGWLPPFWLAPEQAMTLR